MHDVAPKAVSRHRIDAAAAQILIVFVLLGAIRGRSGPPCRPRQELREKHRIFTTD